jgi:hypothetical protein
MYRYYQPGEHCYDPLTRTMAAIERQVALAHESGTDVALTALCVFTPVSADDIETLLDLADEVYSAEGESRAVHERAQGEYVAWLTGLACAVRDAL